jgi:hypothetical protein
MLWNGKRWMTKIERCEATKVGSAFGEKESGLQDGSRSVRYASKGWCMNEDSISSSLARYVTSANQGHWKQLNAVNCR